jgi:hypothetical protein
VCTRRTRRPAQGRTGRRELGKGYVSTEAGCGEEGKRTDLGRAVETTDEVWGDLVLSRVRRRAQVAQLQHRLGVIDLRSTC